MKTKNRILLALFFACISLGIVIQGCEGCKCTPELAQTVAVTLRPQETNNWCWAATTQMISSFMGVGRTQCDLANQRFGRTDCCTGNCPKTDSCNRPGWTMFDECGLNSVCSNTALSWDEIKNQIFCRKQPMSYAYGPKSGGVGHVVVLNGYAELGNNNTDRYIYIKDPWAPCTGNTRFIN